MALNVRKNFFLQLAILRNDLPGHTPLFSYTIGRPTAPVFSRSGYRGLTAMRGETGVNVAEIAKFSQIFRRLPKNCIHK
jgi:hypothetical protein